MVVAEIYIHIPPQQICESHGRSTVGILERACFGLTAFVMQCKFCQSFEHLLTYGLCRQRENNRINFWRRLDRGGIARFPSWPI